MPSRYQPAVLQRLLSEVQGLRDATLALEHELAPQLERVPADWRASARNLAHYLAVRRHDIRAMQMELRHLGLSSLGRLEAHVGAALESVQLALAKLADEPRALDVGRAAPSSFHSGEERLERHAAELFGPLREAEATVRIMVTLPSEAADDRELVRDLLDAGMDVARINAAHDDPATWRRMADNVRAQAAELGRIVRVLIDLAGPKLRTGEVAAGPHVMRVKPRRDARGSILEPAELRLASVDGESLRSLDGAPVLPVDGLALEALRPGDQLLLRDAPGRSRRLVVETVAAGEVRVSVARTTWFETGQELRLLRDGERLATGRVGRLAARPGVLELLPGDPLLLTAAPDPGRSALRDGAGRVIEPARVPCTLPSVLAEVSVGDRVLFDDGVIEGRIERASPAELELRITRTPPKGGRLRSDKGINLPDSKLTLPSLSDADREALGHAVRLADIVGLSFVRGPRDVESLHAALDELGASELGVLLKIETRRGFDNLPRILLAALRRPPVGVMVARGDLGVEVGFERMAEVQEQILWLCEAAHVPVVWATQVLEGLAKTGMPTRGEVTDAAMSARAECVMLNKGPYIVQTVRFLENVLQRMRDHHIKKTPMLRRLKVSEGRWHEEPSGAG